MIPVFKLPRDNAEYQKRCANESDRDEATSRAVAAIIARVRSGGDRALLECTREFDGVELSTGALRLPARRLRAAWESLPRDLKSALQTAKRRVTAFHKCQKPAAPIAITDAAGVRLAQQWIALDSVGIYVPGGTAAYPSTVLMDAIPARVAGVRRIVAVTPPPREGRANEVTLAALHLAGVTEVYQVGGAQAVAALAYGTATIPRVDKVVGPGNLFVAEAKRQLFGTIDIDMVAGPSEVMILADDSAPLDWIAADLLAQAEHDPEAQAIAVVWGGVDAEALVARTMERARALPRWSILERSLAARAAVVRVRDAKAAVAVAEAKAPEHLELMCRGARTMAKSIRNAGSIFIGVHSAEALGDYVAGPTHVLPTGGSARFASPLSVQSFLRLKQTIEVSADGLEQIGPAAIRLARAEGLDGHAESVGSRLSRRGRGV